MDPPPPRSLIERAVAAAKLAMGDGREHVLRNGHVLVAVGDGEFGGAVALGIEEAGTEHIDVLGRELRRVLGGFRAGWALVGGARSTRRALPDWLAVAPQSVEGLAHALAEAARATTGYPAAVALRDYLTRSTSIVAVSQQADRMLVGVTATPESAVGRACAGDIPVVAPSFAELLGREQVDRRTRRGGGTAFPLRDGREGVGVLIVFGDRETVDAAVLERVLWLTVDAGPRLASGLAVRAAKTQALTDHLTGLPNRRALEQRMAKSQDGPCSMLCVDIDHFKRFNDGHGHLAGDAALRHVAQIFRRSLREHDLAARIGGEEFALWLPETPLSRAVEVGERVRKQVAGSALYWDGLSLKVTCSVGVASVPETVGQPDNLFSAADAALYQAKRAGRNRVQASAPRARPP
jgi:diguanylate cyclase (GGDEF)-like protein